MTERIEYRARPVTRYIITRYSVSENAAGVETKGEHDNADVAYEVAYALAKHDHQIMGWPLDDERIQYPRHPCEVLN